MIQRLDRSFSQKQERMWNQFEIKITGCKGFELVKETLNY